MAEQKPQSVTRRRFRGEVVSSAMDKTIVVRVDAFKMHPQYSKRYRVSRRYHVHDEQNRHQVGETVEFVECRPLSRHKRWRVIESKA